MPSKNFHLAFSMTALIKKLNHENLGGGGECAWNSVCKTIT